MQLDATVSDLLDQFQEREDNFSPIFGVYCGFGCAGGRKSEYYRQVAEAVDIDDVKQFLLNFALLGDQPGYFLQVCQID